MEMHKVSLKEIKVEPLAHELATSDGTRPYLDCLIQAHCDKCGDKHEAECEGASRDKIRRLTYCSW
jgi:hypothetical protein